MTGKSLGWRPENLRPTIASDLLMDTEQSCSDVGLGLRVTSGPAAAAI